MSGTFSFFSNERQPVSSGTLSALIQLQRQDLLTGVVEIVYPGDVQALLFFNLGAPFTMYFYEEGNWRRVPSTQWNDIFAQANGQASIIPLGGDCVRTCIMALEAGQGQPEELLLRPAGFEEHLGRVKVGDSASLLRVRDEAFHSLMVIPGRGVNIQDVLIFTPSGIQTDAKTLMRLLGGEDRLIRISQIEFSQFPHFMEEYALRVAFLSLAEPALKRFEQLAGDTLVEALGREVNNYAYHQGWKIQFFGDRVVHRQYFQEAGEATVVYRSLFRLIRHYIHQVVGASLTSSILNEGLNGLPDAYRDILNQRNFLAA